MAFKRSEQKLNNEKPGGWLYNDEDDAQECEASCCPCFVYSRSKFRLNEAKNRRNGNFETYEQYLSKVPIFPIVTPSCFVFAACCFPFYGSFISSLRGQVRRFYNIGGSSSTDF
ncbi:hypothetical protein ACHAPJ_009268 [Fusarium lateritium]